MAWDGRVDGEGCYVWRILGKEGYVQELYRIRGTVNAMGRAWRTGLEQRLKA
jgi:hypothetical protein